MHRIALVALLGICAGAAGTATSQPAGGKDLNDLTLLWTRGSFAAPLLCEFGDSPKRGLRRIDVVVGPISRGKPTNRLRFVDLEPDGASRCFDALGTPEMNLIGSIDFALPGRSRPDTAQRDFDAGLRRSDGFEFEIRKGSVQVIPIAEDSGDPKILNLAGGTASFKRVKRGTDAHRLLAEFPQTRKFSVRLRSPGGEELQFRMVHLPR